MAEYIDKKEVLHSLKEYLEVSDMPDDWNEGMERAIKIVKTEKVEDVAPVKHGEWISIIAKKPDWKGRIQEYYQPITCDNCKQPQTQKSNYCPNCGAKMKGVEK